MDFRQAQQEYERLEQLRSTGRLTDEQYRSQLSALRVTDAWGRLWMLQERSGRWHVWQGGQWLAAEPPQMTPPPAAAPGPTSTAPTPAPQPATRRREPRHQGTGIRVWPWALGGLVVLLFLGAILWAVLRPRPPWASQRGTPSGSTATAAPAPTTSGGMTPAQPSPTTSSAKALQPSPTTGSTKVAQPSPTKGSTAAAQPTLAAGKLKLPAEMIGAASGQASPAQGLILQAGAAQVVIRPAALARPCAVKAELSADGRLRVTLDPPQVLAVPALVTLPLPPGAATGDDPRTWPVAILQSAGQEPLILQAEAVGGSEFIVAVPHFSDLIPDLFGEAVKRAGQAGADLVKQMDAYSPRQISLSFTPAQDYTGSAQVSTMNVAVQVRANTKENNGLPKLEKDKLLPQWGQFKGLRLKYEVVDPAKPESFSDLFPSSDPPQITLSDKGAANFALELPAGFSPACQIVVALYSASGVRLFTRTFGLPKPGGLWGLFECAKHPPASGDPYLNVRVYYITDTQMVGYPDASYTKDHNPPTAGVPATVHDVCEAVTTAYTTLSGPDYFANRGLTAPNLPIVVWLTPWDESRAANWGIKDLLFDNYIMLATTGNRTWEVQFVEAAHEVAHLFQQVYSVGLSGASWLHDASAEYLAERVWGTANNQAGVFIQGGASNWLPKGLQSAQDTDNYAAASFLGFLAEKDGVQVPALWYKGGQYLNNLVDWSSYIDGVIKQKRKEGLRGAWIEFTSAYLLDRSRWGEWTGSTPSEAQWSIKPFLLTHDAVYANAEIEIPALSAGALPVTYYGPEAETLIVYRVGPQGEIFGPPTDMLFVAAAGAEADGKGQVSLKQWQGAILHASLPLRIQATGVRKPTADSRLVVVNAQNIAYKAVVEAWALPQVQGVFMDLPNLRWDASPLERAKLASGGASVLAGYEVIGHRAGVSETVLATVKPGAPEVEIKLEWITGDKAMDLICVRLRDYMGNLGPEGCPPLEFMGRYTGTLTYKEVNFDTSQMNDIDLDGDGKVDITKSQCEQMLKELEGQTARIVWEFVPKGRNEGIAYYSYQNPDKSKPAGEQYAGAWKQLMNAQGDAPQPLTYRVTGATVVIETKMESAMGVKVDTATKKVPITLDLRFEGQVGTVQGKPAVSGSFVWNYISSAGATFMTIKGPWEVSR